RAPYLGAAAGLADDLDPGGATEQHRQAAAHERVVVDDHDPDRPARAGVAVRRRLAHVHGNCAVSWKPPPGSGPWRRVPPASVTRSPTPIRPVPAATWAGWGRAGGAVGDGDAHPGGAVAGQLDRDELAGRVLAGVGQRLLDQPVDGPSE